ncbi:MAG: ParA family protein [Rhodoferax sp.]|nr:ParA family protein [Rhodoferax sp.]
MPVVVVANPKGGVGKSTLATNIAGYFAAQGHAVMLGDTDRQQSSRLWLGLRPGLARPITTWDVNADQIAKPPKGTTHVVLDTPAGLHGWRFNDLMKLADRVIVPLQPSVFDIFATRSFLDRLLDNRHAGKLQIGIVGMRVDERTLAADKLREFVGTLGVPVLGFVRDTQNYIHLAARGLTLFDVAPGRVEKDLEQWQPIGRWLDQ